MNNYAAPSRSFLPLIYALGLGLFVAFLAVFSGLAIGFMGWKMGILLIVFLVVAVSFFIPLTWVFWLLVVTTFVLSGPIQYFGKVDKIFWLPYLVGLLLLLRTTVQHAFSGARATKPGSHEFSNVSIALAVALYCVALVGSSLLNGSPVYQVILSLKEYFFLWGAGLAVVWGLVKPDAVDRILKHSHWFLLIQLPAILYQRFVIAPGRLGTSTWDAVVGLMSGNQDGGGASATMALIVILIMVYHLGAWRAGLSKLPKLLLVMGTGLASIMFAEVKYAILLIPIAFSLVYTREIVRRPVFGLAYLAFVLSLGFLVLYAYQTQFAADQTKGSKSVADYVEQTVERNTGGDQFNLVTGEMGRLGAIELWWQDNSHNGNVDDPFHTLLGHGIGASRIGFVAGEVVLRYRFVIGRSTLVILLWEGGVLAAFSLGLLLAVAAFEGFRRARKAQPCEASVVLRTAAIGLVLTLFMVPYGSDLMVVAQAQLLAVLMIARIAVAAAARPASAVSPMQD